MQRKVKINGSEKISIFDKVEVVFNKVNGTQQWHSEISLICSDAAPTLIRYCRSRI